MTNTLSTNRRTLACIEAEVAALPKGWTPLPASVTSSHVRYESQYERWTLRIDVFAMAGRPELAFEAALLSGHPLLARSETLLVATVNPDDRPIAHAFDLVWQAVAARRDIEKAVHRAYRRRWSAA